MHHLGRCRFIQGPQLFQEHGTPSRLVVVNITQKIAIGAVSRLFGAAQRDVVPARSAIVAICRASGEDLGAIMVREGFAWAFTRFSVDYVDQQEEARRANRGVHAHDCVPGWEWRAQRR
jgi:hypothetical protein